jgi:hypothetical protein
MSFSLYSLGFAIVIGGLIYAAYLLHVPTGVKATRQKDPVG